MLQCYFLHLWDSGFTVKLSVNLGTKLDTEAPLSPFPVRHWLVTFIWCTYLTFVSPSNFLKRRQATRVEVEEQECDTPNSDTIVVAMEEGSQQKKEDDEQQELPYFTLPPHRPTKRKKTPARNCTPEQDMAVQKIPLSTTSRSRRDRSTKWMRKWKHRNHFSSAPAHNLKSLTSPLSRKYLHGTMATIAAWLLGRTTGCSPFRLPHHHLHD